MADEQPTQPRQSNQLEFLKVEGLGNDFLLLDVRERSAVSLERLRSLAPRLCDRRTGVGGDGLLVVTESERGLGRMIVINHDGTRPEMCGNGLRCVALHLALETGQAGTISFDVETDAGLLRCDVSDVNSARRTGQVLVRMGPATRLGTREPAAAPGFSCRAISMGNPHAIAMVDQSQDPERLARELGPGVEIDPLFPARTNVEFVRREADGSLLLWVWERGCGITHACGTGACATAAAAVDHGIAEVDRELTVRLPGGALGIRVPSDPSADVEMRGPATVVFQGLIDLNN